MTKKHIEIISSAVLGAAIAGVWYYASQKDLYRKKFQSGDAVVKYDRNGNYCSNMIQVITADPISWDQAERIAAAIGGSCLSSVYDCDGWYTIFILPKRHNMAKLSNLADYLESTFDFVLRAEIVASDKKTRPDFFA